MRIKKFIHELYNMLKLLKGGKACPDAVAKKFAGG